MIGELSALVTAVFWSGSMFAFAGATRRLGSVRVNIVRLVLAMVFLFATILLFGVSMNVSLSQIGWFALSGFVGFVFGDSALFKSYEYLNPRITALIMALSPAIAAILAFVVLDEVIGPLVIAGIVITLAGIGIVVWGRRDLGASSKHSRRETEIGMFFAFLAAVGQGGGLVIAKMAFREGEVNGMVATLFRIMPSVLMLTPWALMKGKLSKPVQTFKDDRIGFRLTLIGAVCGPYLGVTCSLIAVANTSVGIAATIMALVPVIMLPIAYYYFKEKLSWQAVVGAVVAVAGVAILFAR